MRKSFLMCLAAMMVTTPLWAQQENEEEKAFGYEAEIDFQSALLWRGDYSKVANLQSTVGVSYKGLFASAWGFLNQRGETMCELSAGYEYSNATLYFIQYMGNEFAEEMSYSYGYPKESYNYFELNAGYTLPWFPLSVNWSTVFSKTDSDETDKQLYSSYLECSYEAEVKGVTLTASVGASPWKSMYTDSNGFKVTDLSLRAEHVVGATKQLSIPLRLHLAYNPHYNEFGVAIGIALSFNN